MTEGKLQWHPAFVAALHIEFENELDVLEIKSEHLLGKKPLRAGRTPRQANLQTLRHRHSY